MNSVKTFILSLLLATLFLSAPVAAENATDIDRKPDIIGKTYLFDYQDYAYEIEIKSAESLHWRLVKGAFEGPKEGSNPYLASRIADGILFISWIEESGMQFYNLMDLNSGTLTTHANVEGLFINMGKVSLKRGP